MTNTMIVSSGPRSTNDGVQHHHSQEEYSTRRACDLWIEQPAGGEKTFETTATTSHPPMVLPAVATTNLDNLR